MTRPLRTPDTTKAGSGVPASSDKQSALVSTLSLATVPQNLDLDEPEFDTALYFMAACSVATDLQVLAISRNVKAEDLLSADATIFAVMVDLARAGTAPSLPLIHGELARQGLFGGHKEHQLKKRMLDLTTTNASPLQLDQLAHTIVSASFRRAGIAMGAGVSDAFKKYPDRDLMPYTRQLGTQLAAIDNRRMALGGESQ